MQNLNHVVSKNDKQANDILGMEYIGTLNKLFNIDEIFS